MLNRFTIEMGFGYGDGAFAKESALVSVMWLFIICISPFDFIIYSSEFEFTIAMELLSTKRGTHNIKMCHYYSCNCKTE